MDMVKYDIVVQVYTMHQVQNDKYWFEEIHFDDCWFGACGKIAFLCRFVHS